MARCDPPPLASRPILWPWPEALDDELERRFKADEKVKAIAHDMARPLHVVSARIDILRERGRIPYRSRPWTGPETARLLAFVDGGGRIPHLAPLFKRSRAALREQAYKARRARAAAEAGADKDQFRLELQHGG